MFVSALRLFVLDFPASLVNKPIAEPSLVPSSDDAFLLPVPPMPPRTSSTSRPSQAAKARKVSRVGGLSLETHLQTAYGLCTAVVVMIWLGVGLPRAANLVHTDWPFVGPDMFSRVGSWSSPSPFRDVLFNQMVRPGHRHSPCPDLAGLSEAAEQHGA